MMNVSAKVPADYDGVSVLEYLSRRFTYLPTETWQELITAGKVTCGGEVCTAARIIIKGEIIACKLPEHEPPAVNLDYSIVYEDEWLLAINKPPGLRVHSSGKFVNANLIYHLRHVHQPAYPSVNLVNRLDADTSGLVLLAKEKAVLGSLMRQFAEGTVDKRYLAVVTGHPVPAQGSIDLPIGPVKGARVPRFGINTVAGKSAVTHYQTICRLGDKFTLLELHPETGRTHQLRVHLAAIGHPIAGDALYTLNDADYLAHRQNPSPAATLQRQALHSHRLGFTHPVLHSECVLTAELPADMKRLIEGRKNG